MIRKFPKYKARPQLSETGNNSWGTKSDILDWIINAVVGLITLCLFVLTYQSVQVANDANQISKINATAAQKSNEIADNNYKLALQAFDSAVQSGKAESIKANKLFEMQSSALQNQLEALQVEREQFKNGNRPFLQINNVSVDGGLSYRGISPIEAIKGVANSSLSLAEYAILHKNDSVLQKEVEMSLRLLNASKSSIEILSDEFGYIFAPSVDINQNLKYEYGDYMKGDFINENLDLDYKIVFDLPITKEDLDPTRMSLINLYLYGKIIYQNYITKRKYIKKFCYLSPQFSSSMFVGSRRNLNFVYNIDKEL